MRISWKRLARFGLSLAAFEFLVFSAIAYRIDSVISSQSIFHFPYSMYIEALVRAYWWIPSLSIPLGTWILYKLRRG